MFKVTFEIKGKAEEALSGLADRLGVTTDELVKAAATTFLETMSALEAQSKRRKQRIRELSLSHAQLLELSKTHHPPQEWFDSDDNPFLPE